MTYAEAIRFLYSLQMFGARPGLESTLKLAALAGNPQAKLRFIHVAGTNGKGSTCAMLESIYRAVGLRVGLFTSPHLVAFGERIQINRQPISEAEVVRLVDGLQPLLQTFPADAPPTFFEFVTVMALGCFAGQHCDLVIWETGLGGRLDATNIVTPLASVITNIELDHQAWLGDTHDQIAAEKAGIIKPGVPVITAAEPARGLEVIRDAAQRLGSPFTRITAPDAAQIDHSLPLPGRHQRLNAAVALGVVRALQGRIAVPEDAIRHGLAGVRWPGRLESFHLPSGQTVLLDGAHNAAGAAALRAALEEQCPGARPTLILGVLADKDWAAIARALAPCAGRILLVPVSSERTLPPDPLARSCREANPAAVVELMPSLAEALAHAAGDSFLLITGSLYLVGEAMERLGLMPAPPQSERRLNEWTSRPK